MSEIGKVYDQVKQHPKIGSAEIAKNLNMSLIQVWGCLSNLTRRKYVRYDRSREKGHSYCQYYVTSKYVPVDGVFKSEKKPKRRYTHRAKKEVRKIASLAVKLNGGGHIPTMASRVGIALTMDGKQVVVPVRAAKEVYVQLKEIFA